MPSLSNSSKKRRNERGDRAPKKTKGSHCNESEQEQSGSSSGAASSACNTQDSENVRHLGAIEGNEDRASIPGPQLVGEDNDTGNISFAAEGNPEFTEKFLMEIERFDFGMEDCEITPSFLFEPKRYENLPERVEVLNQHKIRGDKCLRLDLVRSDDSCPMPGDNQSCLLHYMKAEDGCCGYYHQVYVQGEYHYVLFNLTRKKVPHVRRFFQKIRELLSLN